MLVHPRHPDPLPSSSSSAALSSTRPGLPLSRSSSSLAQQQQHRAPLRQPREAPPYPQPSTADGPPAAMAAPPRPAHGSAIPPSDKENARPADPAQPAAQHQDPAAKDKQPKDRAKLTQQWGEPPTRIRRDHSWLDRGDLLGEGGFARVYLCTEPDGVSYKALKVIDKRQLKSTKTKSKLFAEIKIHQAMQHPNIIAFESCFEDEGNVYMQLELCSNGSLLDLLRVRKRYSEPEARFYLTQLVGACDYMHANSVIHRDLKLGNLMLDSNMDLRVGDFGLAALVKFPGERKKTICGTPNYIAPEILFDSKGGHSFEVDIWSIGVILYTLLIGRPPFQTKDVKNIYRKIRDNAYSFPADHALSPESLDLISWILNPTPTSRPTLAQILAHPWFVTGPFPARVSTRATDPSRVDGLLDEWRRMSKRSAADNFRRCKRRAGIVEVEGGAATSTAAMQGSSAGQQQAQGAPEMVSQALPVVVEAPESEPEPEAERAVAVEEEQPRRPTRMLRLSEERDAKGRVEKEVRQATAPESPISELLRSARKPLMVSPSSRAALPSRPSVRSRLSASASTAPPTSSASSSSAAPASSAASAGPSSSAHAPPPQQPAFQRTRTTSAPTASSSSSAAAATLPVRHRRAPAQAQLDAPAPAHGPSTTSHPSRTLYDTAWRTLDAFLGCSSAADVAVAAASLPDDGEVVDEDERPRVFITSWVDYTHKYGTAYSLTDGTAGLYFNDSTTMVLSPDKEHFDYIANRQSNIYTRRHHALSAVPAALERKAYLLRYFEDYMAKTLRRDVEWTYDDVERTNNMEFLVKYYRMKSAIVFKMSNDVLQFNFYDHHKLILSHSGRLVTFISPSFALTTYSLPALFRLAVSAGHYSHSSHTSSAPESSTAASERAARLADVRTLLGKVEYVRDVLKTLAQRKSSSSTAVAAAAGGGARDGGRERAERA